MFLRRGVQCIARPQVPQQRLMYRIRAIQLRARAVEKTRFARPRAVAHYSNSMPALLRTFENAKVIKVIVRILHHPDPWRNYFWILHFCSVVGTGFIDKNEILWLRSAKHNVFQMVAALRGTARLPQKRK